MSKVLDTLKCGLLLVILVFLSVPAVGDPVPRILLAGDSWSALMQAFGTYQEVLPEFPGCENFRSVGFRTSVVGIRANEFIEPAMLETVAEELALYPTIDIVHLSLGGNDILYGRWLPTMSPSQQENLFNTITANIETAIDFILAQRPDIRVGLCGYTFADHDYVNVLPTQANQAITMLEEKKLAMVQGKERVFYIHNLGLMQYAYGIPQADPPIAPETVPYPGGYPDYNPMPGGDILYAAPEVALVDSDVHLTPEGYKIVARRCMNEFYAEWLSWPRVLETRLLSATTAQAVFQVRFSETVTGVDVSDLAPSMQTKSPAVVSVTGSADTWTVTVTLDGGSGTIHLDVLDDDTIIDLDGNPLGGPGAGNGLFSFNGTLSYQDPPPLDDDDFDAFLIYLDTASAPYTEQLNGFSFDPEVCDANGGFQTDPVQVNGNGMLESCEFGLIRACLRDPDLDLRDFGGVSHAIVLAAWENNLAQMRADLGGTDGLALSMLQGLDSILAAYFILGDSVSRLLPSALVFAAVSYDEIQLDLTVPDPMNYRMLPRFFAFSGDADGDGFTNKEEYDYFMPLGGCDLYIKAALTPFITPESSCANTEGGVFSEGDMFCLVVPDPVAYASGFQWLKDGQPLYDVGSIQGSQWRTLHIMSLRVADSGDYTCEYDDGSKSARVFGPVNVKVLKTTPALAPHGLLFLAAFLLCAAVVLLYRFRPIRP